MADVAAAVLATVAHQDEEYKSILVDKPIELEIDLGNMLAIDNNQMEIDKLINSDHRDKYLKEVARDNTQVLINAIWNLPTQRVEEVVVAKFPPPTFKLPREKPVPKPKEPTKWEKYAKEKGIVNKKKKDRLVWDDVLSKWVPQFGYKKKLAEKEKNWCIPIKEVQNPNLTPFEKMEEDKKERNAKNELQRLRNIARVRKVKIPTVGVVTPSVQGNSVGFSDDLKNAAQFAKTSTASLGKFQPNLTARLEKTAKTKGKKRKFESNTGSSTIEKERNLGILESITNKQAKIDINMAIKKKSHLADDAPTEVEHNSDKERKTKKKGGGHGKRDGKGIKGKGSSNVSSKKGKSKGRGGKGRK